MVAPTPSAGSARASAAALALACCSEPGPEGGCAAALLADLDPGADLRASVLCAEDARGLAGLTGELDGWSAVPRGRLCLLTPAGEEGGAELAPLAELAQKTGAALVAHVPDAGFRTALNELEACEAAPGVLVQARPEKGERPLLAALSIELRSEGRRHRIWRRAPGLIAGRRALAGLDPGGETARRATRAAAALREQDGQMLPAVAGLIVAVLAVALALVALGGAVTAKGRAQRAADLAALSAARSMREDFARLFAPPLLPDGSPNPAHIDKRSYESRAADAAREAAAHNDLPAGAVRVTFPDGASPAPLRVAVEARPHIEVSGVERGRVRLRAEAALAPPAPSIATSPGDSATAVGGGYSGPLATRQGKTMRPDVAAAFDRMAATAAADGVTLLINSAYRSDAEQAALFAANPDPRMVAPPGKSLHRCGTELDLGPPSAYGWLSAHASGFGFEQRYSWESWHYGFVRGPAPCSAAGDEMGAAPPGAGRGGDGRISGEAGLPSFVPPRYRSALVAAASRHDVSAALLAAQLMAESDFNPAAISSAGAEGIAQFMPATAAAYGLDDPFDPEASIEAQATLMGELIDRFGDPRLALAAYNAGPGPVAACSCVPGIPETQAYVARIVGLLAGAGQLSSPAPLLEVRLVS